MNTEQQQPTGSTNSERHPYDASEESITGLKERLNGIVWEYAAAETTLDEAENMAIKMLLLFTENREKFAAQTRTK